MQWQLQLVAAHTLIAGLHLKITLRILYHATIWGSYPTYTWRTSLDILISQTQQCQIHVTNPKPKLDTNWPELTVPNYGFSNVSHSQHIKHVEAQTVAAIKKWNGLVPSWEPSSVAGKWLERRLARFTQRNAAVKMSYASFTYGDQSFKELERRWVHLAA